MPCNAVDFDEFNVIQDNNKYIFFHLNIKDEKSFYAHLFNYFFNEDRILSYFQNKKYIKYEPTIESYCALYESLKLFIDEFNLELLSNYPSSLHDVIEEEHKVEIISGIKKVRLDKVGKIGEYILSHILVDYFKCDCILPKLILTTDYNVSVFGIDTIHYSSKENMILFGESKVTVKISNGISLINEALINYEKQINDEYSLVLSSRLFPLMNEDFKNKYNNLRNTSITFKDFIKKAEIKSIGIPLFISHGTEIDEKKIINQLNKIKQNEILGVPTKYILISLPIINKNELKKIFSYEIGKKVKYYENLARKQ